MRVCPQCGRSADPLTGSCDDYPECAVLFGVGPTEHPPEVPVKSLVCIHCGAESFCPKCDEPEVPAPAEVWHAVDEDGCIWRGYTFSTEEEATKFCDTTRQSNLCEAVSTARAALVKP